MNTILTTPIWSFGQRAMAFTLASTSIWCLLADFYGLCSMRLFALAILAPATALLIALGVINWTRGDRRFARPVLLGSVAGFAAALAYDVFRAPFVWARPLGIDGVIPAMNLFKVFPAFGAMLLGQPPLMPSYSITAHVLGWIYHFSNAATFGIMYWALVADPRRRHWGWAVAFALFLEIAMLLTPYPSVFGIAVTARFVAVTIAAHAVFGIAMGLAARRVARQYGGEGQPVYAT